MLDQHSLLCLFEGFEPSDSSAGHNGLHAIHATLKLWGEAYQLCANAEEFKNRIAELGREKKRVIVVLNSFTPEVLLAIEHSKA